MSYGDRAAEQHEKDQPSQVATSCLRPAGVKPELEPIKDRGDFETRMRRVLGRKRLLSDLRSDVVSSGRGADSKARNLSYADEKIRAAEAEMDQLVLMRSAQILEEAEQRRREVMAKFSRPRTQWEVLENLAEMTLDADERRGD